MRSSPGIIIMGNNSRKMRWAVRVARIRQLRNEHRICWKTQRKDLGADGRTLSKLI
jgi:hypothetical protein